MADELTPSGSLPFQGTTTLEKCGAKSGSFSGGAK